MLGIKWKYIIILAILAGIIYFIISIFTLGTVESIEGNPVGYILLIITWLSLVVICRVFQEKIRIKDLPRYMLLGMIIHVYLCFFYFLNEISEFLALITLPVLLLLIYGWHNKDALRFFAIFSPSGHPYAYDKEYKAYVYKEEDEWLKAILIVNLILWIIITTAVLINELSIIHASSQIPLINLISPKFPQASIICALITGIIVVIILLLKYWCKFKALKYLKIKSGHDPADLFTIFYQAKAEISLEIHYINNTLNFYCGVMATDRAYDQAMITCKKRFYELYNYLRMFGYEPMELWDDYTLEKVLEGPYLCWDPLETPKISNNSIPDDEAVILEAGIKKLKTSLFQLNSRLSLMQRSRTHFKIQRSTNRQVKTEIIESSDEDSGVFTFLDRIQNSRENYENFVFILRLHPYDEQELSKEQKRIRSNLTRVLNSLKASLQNDLNYKMLKLNTVLESSMADSRRGGIFRLIYPNESKEFEQFWQQLDNYQLGEEIGFWKISAYFVGKRYLANVLATHCKAKLMPLKVTDFRPIIKRDFNGKVENLDSKGLVNYLPFDPFLETQKPSEAT